MPALLRLLGSLTLAASIFAAAPLLSASTGSPALTAYEAKNYREAMRLFKPLAEQGNAEAQYYVGRMYEKGQGVRQDKKEVVKWYRRSAEGGYPPAQYRLAVGYAWGYGELSRDDAEAVKWLRQSAEGGYKKAQKYLGRAYAEGRFGLPVDPQQAEYWTKKAESNS